MMDQSILQTEFINQPTLLVTGEKLENISRMPIDGTLMIDNPVQSSFPPSRVFKVIQKNHNDAIAFDYLRRAREALFAFNQNISDQSVMIEIVNKLGLDGEAIVNEAEQPIGQQLLNEDFGLS